MGDTGAQNKLGTLLYVQAKKQKGEFTDAIQWFKRATAQEHPIAQLNLAFETFARDQDTASTI